LSSIPGAGVARDTGLIDADMLEDSAA